MYTLILILHVILGIAVVLAILVFQTSKGSALAMFGGGGDALFNAASGTSFIKKFTMVTAGLFAVTSLLLTIIGSTRQMSSVVQEFPMQQRAPQQQAAPAQPAPHAPKK